MAEVILDAQDIVGGYGKAVVVQGFSAQLRKGELVALVGPNGSGKSTFIKSIYGLATLFEGRVMLDGEDVTRLSPEEKSRLGLGYVPQVANVFPDLTVVENLEMGAYAERSKAALRGTLEEILELFPLLADRRSQMAVTLSGGERQILALGRALMGHPKVLFLDEPTAALAPKVVTRLFREILEIRDAGVAVLLVEQHAKRALEIANRGYVLVAGKKAMEGTGQEILNDESLKQIFLGRK